MTNKNPLDKAIAKARRLYYEAQERAEAVRAAVKAAMAEAAPPAAESLNEGASE